ncbi:hypothetical protein EJ06DRAFT_550833 [Trichodelitschia bisporula]|uniref:Autophagy-related protein 14 n=1 Tax=Trichodelitschia bisporula TaxID=703511 RepID=A0A6G1HPN7_9PEZI|nr:hypothetical protein EJ06DRAFT_550833 [Trichodelitschia bisporula]
MAEANVEIPGSLRRERPWLYPYNRRLRHLQGLTIRNLALTPRQHAAHPLTLDDEVLPSTRQSPAKALAQREHRELGHSRSSSDLRPLRPAADGSPRKLDRDRPAARLRRRSTLDWTDAPLQTRQRRLENVLRSRMADVFFSLHVDGEDAPVYISEVVPQTMNPNFRSFDLSPAGPSVTRRAEVQVRVWAKNADMRSYRFLIEMTLSLRALQFVGKTLEGFRQPLPENCILFHLTDGVYTSFTDFPTPDPPLDLPVRALSRVQPTASYGALMRLATLDECIQDALATRARLEAQINDLLAAHEPALNTLSRASAARESLSATTAAAALERRRLDAARSRRDELRSRLASRRSLIAAARESISQTQNDLAAARPALDAQKQAVQGLADEMHAQRRRICADLCDIFPIEPAPRPAPPLAFTIRGLRLPPHGDFTSAGLDDGEVGAALGHAAQLVGAAAAYLGVALPYGILARGSRSEIEDGISATAGARGMVYPLYLKGAVRYKFEYGVFLLDKDVEMLAAALGVKVLDVRQTLANLLPVDQACCFLAQERTSIVF